jgi:5-(aminomethyl)-3-furanmethanol phosphate kinase
MDRGAIHDYLKIMIVVKVGGSLYDWPELRVKLKAFLQSLNSPVVVMPGGGDFCEAVRKYDLVHSMPAADSHRLALAALQSAAHFLKWMLGDAFTVIDDYSFVGPDMPENWTVTSDSMASCYAVIHQAHEVVLLKSRCADSQDFDELSKQGIVDHHFPVIMKRYQGQVRIVSLRDW